MRLKRLTFGREESNQMENSAFSIQFIIIVMAQSCDLEKEPQHVTIYPKIIEI